MASMLMGWVLYATYLALEPVFQMRLWRHLAFFTMLAVGLVAYIWIGQKIGAFKIRDFKRAVNGNHFPCRSGV